MNKNELASTFKALKDRYNEFKNSGLKLNMARGKPSTEQLDLSMDMLDILKNNQGALNTDNADCRNYGFADGLPSARKLLAQLMEVNYEDVIAGGNSSLEMMFDAISFFMTHGAPGFEPWIKQGKIRFLCPCPGYDRHFKISEYFGMELITIGMNQDGPDMDAVEELTEGDSSIKGIWCVPKYSNPQGITYSDDVVRRFASLRPAANDFRIFWDNAYCVHNLKKNGDKVLNIMQECEKYGNEELPIIFCSTSKITFAGSGIAGMACRGNNIKLFRERYSIKSVGPDKLNQLRHVLFLGDVQGIKQHMEKHLKILEPKFRLVIDHLQKEFGDNPIVKWSAPNGGYFISADVMQGCAKRVVELCKDAGLTMTDAGATFPYGIDPLDSNIRIAPTYPLIDDLEKAMNLFCLCIKIATIEKLTIHS